MSNIEGANGSGLNHMPMPTRLGETRHADLIDALQHVMADALALTAVASFAAWNASDEEFVRLFRRHVKSGRLAQGRVAACFRDLDTVVALHPTDPAEVPRWMLAAQSTDSIERLVTLAAAIEEFVRSLDACGEVAREAEVPHALRTMTSLSRRYGQALAELTAQVDAAIRVRVEERSER